MRRRSACVRRPAVGLSLPHAPRMQVTMRSAVSRADLPARDRIFYDSPVSHVSVCIGNGQRAHASTPAQPVEVVESDSMGGIVAMRRIAGRTPSSHPSQAQDRATVELLPVSGSAEGPLRPVRAGQVPSRLPLGPT